MSNINKIKVSGQTYNIQDQNATKTLELTQAEYDALDVKDPNTFYIITDSEGFDLSNYYTKSETSGATQISTALASKADKSEIPSLDGYATETWVEGKGYLTEHQDISGKLDVSAFNTYSGSVNTQLNSKASESDLNALNDTVTAHTANASIHVTAADKAAWNAKSDFSGSYNDLTDKPTIPIVPTNVSSFNNDAGYITSNDISGKQDVSGMTAYTTTATTNTLSGTVTAHTADTTIHVTAQDKTNWNNKSDFSGSYNDLTNKLSAGTNITIVDNVISAEGGGGKAVSAGTNISITTGETADTVSCTLPISYGGVWGHTINLGRSDNKLTSGDYNLVQGVGTEVKNNREMSCCSWNVSRQANFTFGDSGNTLFSVGNGTSNSARHNAFEIRQNGDIYLTKDGQDVKLQDQLGGGGGGSSYTAGDGIDITNDVISVTGKVDTTAFTAHTADTVIHVTSAEKTAWNAKSDFSGSYNDLTDKPTIPTVPTSNTAFTNDAGYITSDAISGKADTSAVTESINAAVSGKVDTSTFNTYSGSVDTALNAKADTATTYTKTEVDTALGGKVNTSTYNTYTAATDTAIAGKQATLVSGTNIKTINNESILGSGNIDIQGGGKAVSAGTNISITTGETADTINCTLPISKGSGNNNSLILGTGNGNAASGQYSISVGGRNNSSSNYCSLVGGNENNVSNDFETAFGNSNTTSYVSSTFGNSGNTLFSIGNGSNYLFRHNAFEIRQDGSIYIPDLSNGTSYRDRPMIKLQDALEGSSITVDTALDSGSTNPVANSAITTALNNTVKLSNLSTYYINGFTNYVNRTIPIFHRFDITNQSNGKAWWFGKINDKYVITTGQTSVSPSGLMNLQVIETSAITTSIASSSTDAQVPSAKAVNDKLGGLSLVKLTQSEYDALSTKDSNTLYVIVN